ncbi:hypothetical protein EDB19DRAFT_1904888 [Suillus lakei]|nr:hypothetical protein EDB19DRAFT_1904888 [Suillus lakei]
MPVLTWLMTIKVCKERAQMAPAMPKNKAKKRTTRSAAKHGLHNHPTKHLPETAVCCATRSGKYCNLPVERSPAEIDASTIKVEEPSIPHIMKEVSLEVKVEDNQAGEAIVSIQDSGPDDTDTNKDGAMDASTIKQDVCSSPMAIKQQLELGEPSSPSMAADVNTATRNGPGSLGPTMVKEESREME